MPEGIPVMLIKNRIQLWIIWELIQLVVLAKVFTIAPLALLDSSAVILVAKSGM